MAKTIQELQADLARFRASKSGTSTPEVIPGATPSPMAPIPSTTSENVSDDGIGKALETYRSQKQEGTLQKKVPKDNPNMLMEFAKGIFSAPATIVARPFQAAAAIAGASNDQIDEFTNKIPVLGGLIADAPDNFSDVKKDVGRAAQTVALGTGAPIAGGALFGAGASLEQGNDLFSSETAIQTALGGAGGKVLEWVGKPLLNAAGKVVGTITPQVIKDVAKGGAKAIQEFAATHQLLGGIAAKPSELLAKGFQATDDAIMGGVKKTGAAIRDTAASQFPQLSPTEHFKKVNAKDIIRPTTVNEPKYSKATSVYQDAKSRGIDLDQVANERGIIHDQISEGGKYNTVDVVDNIREGNYKVSDSLARPAIKAAEPGVRKIPIEEVRGAMLKKVNDIPASQIADEERAKLIKQITTRYADNSAAARAHPNGYTLTDLHDARIIAAKNGGYKPGANASDALSAQRSREEGRVFASIFDRIVPEEVGMKEFRKELEKNFLLADYLEELHSKKVPAGVTKKAIRLFGKAITATVGGKIGGFPGAILGSQYGDMLFNSFEALPNPIKMKILQSLPKTDPKAFQVLRQYIGDAELTRMMRLALPEGGASSFKEVAPTLFTTPGGKTSSIKDEAIDINAIESGNVKTPKTDRRLRSYLNKVNSAQSGDVYTPDSELPVIKAGTVPKKKKRLNDIY